VGEGDPCSLRAELVRAHLGTDRPRPSTFRSVSDHICRVGVASDSTSETKLLHSRGGVAYFGVCDLALIPARRGVRFRREGRYPSVALSGASADPSDSGLVVGWDSIRT